MNAHVPPAQAVESCRPNKIKPNTSAAVEFLSRFHEGRQWITLTAIPPTKKGIETRSFDNTPKGREAMRLWLYERNGRQNIYFALNELTRAMDKKAERTDVKSLSWLHVDLDPRVGEPHDDERVRILAKLQGYKTKPNLIIDSGGGFQGFWRLREPLPIDGDIEKAESAKLFNLQLERELGGDSCHNIDRIMRVPFSVNVPDERKRKKGRVEALASVVEFTDAVFDVSQFVKAVQVQSSASAGAGGSIKANVSGNVKRITDVNADLPAAVPDWAKVAIIHGEDPDNPGRWKSRSEALFAVTCALVRAGCDDDTIYAVITDPDFKISQSILKRTDKVRYALRQIEQARARAGELRWRELRDKDHKLPKASFHNAKVAVQALGITCEQDTFHDRYLLGGDEIGQYAGDLSDDAITYLRSMISDRFGFDPGEDHTFKAVKALAIENRFDPVLDYLDRRAGRLRRCA
jgi:hypothetical protein